MEPRGDRASALLSTVVGADPAAGLLLEAKRGRERALVEAEGVFGPDHLSVLKLSGVEAELWRRLLDRLRQVAGEVA